VSEFACEFDNPFVDALEYVRQVFISPVLVLFGGFFGPHDFADLVEAADHHDHAF
jgi:hypothetical protein